MLGTIMRLSQRRKTLLLPIIVAASAALAFLVTWALRTPDGPAALSARPAGLTQRETPVVPPTVAHPIAPFAKQIVLGQASARLGATVTLPDSAFVKPSDAGTAWASTLSDPDSGKTDTTVAITFPARSLIIRYHRSDSAATTLASYEGYARQHPDAAHMIDLQGLPALVIKQNTDDLGSNFGVVAFDLRGTEIAVMGHYDESTLRDVARSILARAGS